MTALCKGSSDQLVRSDKLPGDLPSLVTRASTALASARNAAEVLEARDMAGFAYDLAKRSARLNKAKQAHDDLIAAAHRAQANALEIEAQAKRRLADEYDAAQERGEAATRQHHVGSLGHVEGSNMPPVSANDLGLRRDQIHEARKIRDAEVADPGIIRRTLDDQLAAGDEPTRTELRKVVVAAAMRGLRPERKPSRRNPLYVPPTPDHAAWQHVTGTFRAFGEWATPENLSLARQGMEEAQGRAFHHLDVKAIAAGATAFATIKDWISHD